ncbi:methyltransferase domain-containing protein [Mesorhizobium sp.]|uniref:methyltransferase domain-containing protein n=1 Tax=Mesorhizobium sp. TaxID=1871066 RepID=UPI0025CDE339|nr:methyltransferase domain-containing protein [Mesorhizobium sp.]
MLRGHFDELRPLCPRCRIGGQVVALGVTVVEEERDDDIISGILGCAACGGEYPIIDGLPVIVADVRRYVQDNLFYLLARNDLSPMIESLIGDAAGPASSFDSARQYLSSYVWDHWAEFDTNETKPAPGGARPGAIARGLDSAIVLASADLPEGPVLDIGCGAGRTVHELARRTGRRVLGIDLGSSLARAARRAIVEGKVDYPRRRIGIVFDRRSFAVPQAPRGSADVWICDATALPFADGTFAFALGMNVLDCLSSPRDGLVEFDRVLAPGGEIVLSVPFDWTATVTPVENWIGGHSQRSPLDGDAKEILDLLLTDGPMAAGKLRRKSQAIEIPWHVRLHERSCMHYYAYGLAAISG